MMAKQRLIDADQIKRMHTILSKLGVTKEEKVDLMKIHCSDGREILSSKDLYYSEAASIIEHLSYIQQHTPGMMADYLRCDIMRKKIISICREMGWHKGGRADMERIEEWVLKYGHSGKAFNDYKYKELPMLVTQAENHLASFMKGFKR
jgi:hypothetical protein